jgi:restriction system protein
MYQDNDNQNRNTPKIIPPHGGYRDLQSYQMSEIVYDGTVAFCDRFISLRSRTHDQMVQAARSEPASHASGVTEGCMASGTPKKTELKLVGVARANLCWPGEYEDGERTGRICHGDKHSRFQR